MKQNSQKISTQTIQNSYIMLYYVQRIVLLPLDFLHLNTSFNYVERVCFYG